MKVVKTKPKLKKYTVENTEDGVVIIADTLKDCLAAIVDHPDHKIGFDPFQHQPTNKWKAKLKK